MKHILDSKFYRSGNILYNIIYLNFLICLSSLPIITMASAVNAGYKMNILDTNLKTKDYFKEFKKNLLKKMLISSTSFILILFFIYLTLFFIENNFNIFITGVTVFILVEILITYLHLIYMVKDKEFYVMDIVKAAFIKGNTNPVKSILFILITLGFVFLSLTMPILWFFIFILQIESFKLLFQGDQL